MARKDRDRRQEPEDHGDDPDPGQAGHRPRPAEPESWRSVVNSDYDYPEELDDLSRRERRHAKKAWRRDDHDARMAWLRDQRQAEPVSPVAIVVLVVIVMIVILGLGGGLPGILGGGDDKDKQPVGLLTPGQSVPLPTAPPLGTETSEVPSTTPTQSTPPPESRRPPAAAITDASKLVETWARTFYTRDPAVESYSQLINKCAQYVTPGVSASFAAAGDTTYDALKADKGRSTVAAAVVGVPREDVAPVDTPTRITRLLKVTISTTGPKPERFEVPLLITVILQEEQWLISEVSGGTGT